MKSHENKPPLGVTPAFILHEERIRELAEGILRALEPESTPDDRRYQKIGQWSYELNALAKIMHELLYHK